MKRLRKFPGNPDLHAALFTFIGNIYLNYRKKTSIIGYGKLLKIHFLEILFPFHWITLFYSWGFTTKKSIVTRKLNFTSKIKYAEDTVWNKSYIRKLIFI